MCVCVCVGKLTSEIIGNDEKTKLKATNLQLIHSGDEHMKTFESSDSGL
jgi:hypothetical protein